jgi:hypothetical protein
VTFALSDHQIAVRLMALDEGEKVDGWVAAWEPCFPEWETDGHAGDCTKIAMTCNRCVYEDYMARVSDTRRVFGIPYPTKNEV